MKHYQKLYTKKRLVINKEGRDMTLNEIKTIESIDKNQESP